MSVGRFLAALIAVVLAFVARFHAVGLHKWLAIALDWLGNSKLRNKDNFWLRDHFAAPCSSDGLWHSLEPIDGSSLPASLSGRSFRMQPAPRNGGPDHGYFWFDGEGHVVVLDIDDGAAKLTHGRIETKQQKLEATAGYDLFGRPGDLRCWSGVLKLLVGLLFARLHMLSWKELGLANTNVVTLGSRVFALEEDGIPYEIDVSSKGVLFTKGIHDPGFEGPMTAHPKIDPKTGELVFFGWGFGGGVELHFGTLKPDGKLGHYAPRIDRFMRLPFLHDFGVTENFAIIFDSAMHWMPPVGLGVVAVLDRNTFLGIVNRMNGNKIKWLACRPSVALGLNHIINSWETKNGTVVVWAVVTQHVGDIWDSKAYTSYAARFIIDLHGDSVSWRIFASQRGIEFPSVPASEVGQASLYGYALAFESLQSFTHIAKIDLETGVQSLAAASPNCSFLPGEPVPLGSSGLLSTFMLCRGVTYWAPHRSSDLSLHGLWTVPVDAVRAGLHGTWQERKVMNS